MIYLFHLPKQTSTVFRQQLHQIQSFNIHTQVDSKDKLVLMWSFSCTDEEDAQFACFLQKPGARSASGALGLREAPSLSWRGTDGLFRSCQHRRYPCAVVAVFAVWMKTEASLVPPTSNVHLLQTNSSNAHWASLTNTDFWRTQWKPLGTHSRRAQLPVWKGSAAAGHSWFTACPQSSA